MVEQYEIPQGLENLLSRAQTNFNVMREASSRKYTHGDGVNEVKRYNFTVEDPNADQPSEITTADGAIPIAAALNSEMDHMYLDRVLPLEAWEAFSRSRLQDPRVQLVAVDNVVRVADSYDPTIIGGSEATRMYANLVKTQDSMRDLIESGDFSDKRELLSYFVIGAVQGPNGQPIPVADPRVEDVLMDGRYSPQITEALLGMRGRYIDIKKAEFLNSDEAGEVYARTIGQRNLLSTYGIESAYRQVGAEDARAAAIEQARAQAQEGQAGEA